MSKDPIEALDAFYAGCHSAVAPEARRPKPIFRLAGPALGAAFGIAAALAIATFQAEPSDAACEETVRALASRQLADTPVQGESLLKSGMNHSASPAWPTAPNPTLYVEIGSMAWDGIQGGRKPWTG